MIEFTCQSTTPTAPDFEMVQDKLKAIVCYLARQAAERDYQALLNKEDA